MDERLPKHNSSRFSMWSENSFQMQPATEVFIVGGSHSGLGVAKQIFKSLPDVKVTLISTSADYFFNIASPRLLSRPEDVPLDHLLIPIEKLFRKHPESQFEFVHASVTELDPKRKIISTDDGALRKYDYLIIASGSRSSGDTDPCIPVKQTMADILRESIPRAQEAIANAPRIVIGGGGPVGIEMAGEIADAYPDKTVTMVFAGFRLLDDLKGRASIEAGKKLNKLGIIVKSGNKVESVLFNEKTNDWTVVLVDGSTLETDLYISAIGVLPNNSFIPTFLLSQSGWIECDENLAVKNVSDIYAMGDIVNGQKKMAAVIKSHISCVVKNLAADINKVGVRQPLKLPFLDGMLVPIGTDGGTGQIGGFVPWSWMVGFLKGDFLMSRTNLFVFEE